ERREHRAIVVGEDRVRRVRQEFTETRRRERVGLARVEPDGPGGAAAVAENRQPDLAQLRCVAVQSPDEQARHPRRFDLERGQVDPLWRSATGGAPYGTSWRARRNAGGVSTARGGSILRLCGFPAPASGAIPGGFRPRFSAVARRREPRSISTTAR